MTPLLPVELVVDNGPVALPPEIIDNNVPPVCPSLVRPSSDASGLRTEENEEEEEKTAEEDDDDDDDDDDSSIPSPSLFAREEEGTIGATIAEAAGIAPPAAIGVGGTLLL